MKHLLLYSTDFENTSDEIFLKYDYISNCCYNNSKAMQKEMRLHLKTPLKETPFFM